MPSGRRGSAAGVFAVVATLLGWSSIPLFLKHFASGPQQIDSWTSNGWRYGFSALVWLPVLLLGLRGRSLPAGLWVAAVVPSVINTASQAVFCEAHYRIQPGLLSFGLRSNIVFVTIGAAVLFSAERRIIRSPGYLLGVLMVAGGTLGTILLGHDVFEGATLSGVVMAIASGAGFAGYALAVRHFMHGINAIQSFAAISLYTAVGMVGLMLFLGRDAGAGAMDLDGTQFVLLLVSALIGIAFGHVGYYFAIQRLGLAVSAGVVQLQPFFVSLGSLWLFDEVLRPGQWASGTIAIAGAGVILFVQHRHNRSAGRGAPTEAAAELREFAQLPVDHVAAASEAEVEPVRADGPRARRD